MQLLTTNTGSYPRIGDSLEQQRHRIAYTKFERGNISEMEFERVQEDVTRDVIQEQVRAGLDLVTDGQVRWHDPISHFAKGYGCEIDGLLRFFDTNFYIRQPVVRAKLKWRGPVVKREFTYAKKVSPKPVKPVLTGPYTLAKLSIIRREVEFPSLVEEFADMIAGEVVELEEAGARLIQVDEPAILKHPSEFEVFRTAMEKIAAEKSEVELALYTYFGDAVPLYKKLHELPVEVLGFDFTYSANLAKVIAKLGCEKDLGIGLIDGRNTKLEDEREVLKTLGQILPKVKSEKVYLNPSCGLEYLPRDAAFKKLSNMVNIAKKAKGLIR